MQDIHLPLPAPPIPIQQAQTHPLLPHRLPRRHPPRPLLPQHLPMPPCRQSLEPGRTGPLLLHANGHEHTHRARRPLLRHRLRLRRFPHRPPAEPPHQEAEQDRPVLPDGPGHHHGRDRDSEGGDGVADQGARSVLGLSTELHDEDLRGQHRQHRRLRPHHETLCPVRARAHHGP